MTLQLPVEQRRQIVVAIVVAGRGRGLVGTELTAFDVSLRLEQVIEGLHLRGQGLVRLEGVERSHRPAHRVSRRGHRVFLRPRLAGRGHWSALPGVPHGRLAERAGRLFDVGLQIGLGTRNSANVRRGLRPFRGFRSPIELPGRDHHLPLPLDELVERAAVAGSGHRLTGGEREFLLVRLDLEEEDVAPRLVGALATRDIARAA